MTGADDFDRRLAGWLAGDAATPPPSDGFATAIRATKTLRPLPAWRAQIGAEWIATPRPGPDWHLVPESPAGRMLLVAMLALVLTTAALAVGAAIVRDPLDGVALGGLAYTTGDGVVIADWDAQRERRVEEPGRGFRGDDPRWSPDGKWLLVDGVVQDQQGSTVSVFGGRHGAWAPDSSRIAAWVEPYRRIGIFDLGGSLLSEVTLPNSLLPTGDVRPQWLPDGSALYVANLVGPERRAQPWLFPLDGSTPRPIVSVTGYDAAFSPDGSRIAVVTQDGLLIARADGTPENIVLQVPRDVRLQSPSWSPRGDRVAVTRKPLDSVGSSIVIADLRTGATVEVARYSGGTSTVLDWDPSGTLLLVAAEHLLAVKADGSGSEILVDDSGTVGDWQWIRCADPATPGPGCEAPP